MKAVFKSQLDSTELDKIRNFCNSVDYCSIEQSIGWLEISSKSKFCYFYLVDGDEIKSFSIISVSLRFAHIEFGPVCCDKEVMIVSINEIINHYKKQGFFYLDIQMYYKSGYDSEYIEYAINKLHKIRYKFDNDNTKASYEIDLGQSIEDIFGNMRPGHRGTIKKGIKLGITVDVVRDKEELVSFIEIYSRMCKARKIEKGELSAENIFEIYNYLIKNNKGQILIAKDKDKVVLGGIVFVYQGITVRALKGSSDDEKRNLPINHLILYEAIKLSKMNGFKYFDFWGYNHFADENNHVYHINFFKKGFGGYYTFFAKKMNIDLVPLGYYLYNFPKSMKESLIKYHLIKS